MRIEFGGLVCRFSSEGSEGQREWRIGMKIEADQGNMTGYHALQSRLADEHKVQNTPQRTFVNKELQLNPCPSYDWSTIEGESELSMDKDIRHTRGNPINLPRNHTSYPFTYCNHPSLPLYTGRSLATCLIWHTVALELSNFFTSCLTLLVGKLSKSNTAFCNVLDTKSSSHKKNQKISQCNIFAVLGDTLQD